MNKLTAFITLALIISASCIFAAVPDLYVNDALIDRSLYKPSANISEAFNGFDKDTGSLDNTFAMKKFSSSRDVGLWLFNDLTNGNALSDNDAYLFSERALAYGSYNCDGQRFWGLNALTSATAISKTGNAYFNATSNSRLILDDSGLAAPQKINTMMIGLSRAPEPGTLLLLGTGLLGTGLVMRRKRRK